MNPCSKPVTGKGIGVNKRGLGYEKSRDWVLWALSDGPSSLNRIRRAGKKEASGEFSSLS